MSTKVCGEFLENDAANIADQESQFDLRQFGQQMIEPQGCALSARGQVTALSTSRVTITHRYDRTLRCIIKHACIDTHPLAQKFPARIIPRRPRRMYACARRLADNQDARPRRRLEGSGAGQEANVARKRDIFALPSTILQEWGSSYRS